MNARIELKNGVVLGGVQPEVVLGIMIAAQLFISHQINLIVTSVKDGKHKKGSKHYIGHGFDLRTRHMVSGWPEKMTEELKVCLGGSYDVVLELDHIHVEFDPDLTNV